MSSFPTTGTPIGYILPAVAETGVAAPTAPGSTSAFQCQGLAALITPNTPAGNVLAIISATLTDSATTVGEGVILQIAYGPVVSGVAPPTVNTAAPASAVLLGQPRAWATGVTLTTAADSFAPITLHGVAKGLVAGQQYWFDVVAKSVTTASDVALTNVQIDLVEIG